MKIAIVSVTKRGAKLGQQVRSAYVQDHVVDCYEKEDRESGDTAISFSSLKPHIEQLWKDYDRILFIMATGIVVRMIAPFIKHKSEDPAILVMDEGGHFVISLLSGHLGGANEWTSEVAIITGATPVITTATDVNQLPAPDVLARKIGAKVEDFSMLIKVNAAIVNGETVKYYLDSTLADDFEQAVQAHQVDYVLFHPEEPFPWGEEPKVVITDRTIDCIGVTLVLRPPTMTVGIGCRRDTPKELILSAVAESLQNVRRSPLSVKGAASVIVKADEIGLLEAMEALKWPIQFYTQEEMAPCIEEAQIIESNFVKQTIGVGNVCETTALLLAQGQELLQHKTIFPRTTVAIARVHYKSSELDLVTQNS